MRRAGMEMHVVERSEHHVVCEVEVGDRAVAIEPGKPILEVEFEGGGAETGWLEE